MLKLKLIGAVVLAMCLSSGCAIVTVTGLGVAGGNDVPALTVPPVSPVPPVPPELPVLPVPPAPPSWDGPLPPKYFDKVPVEPPVVYHSSRPAPHILVECVRPKGNLNRNRIEHPGTRRHGEYVYQYGICREI